MKGLVILVIALLIQTGCSSSSEPAAEDPWLKADQIVAQIQLPVIPDQSFSLLAHGGYGDGVADNKAVFDRVIAACLEAGGGTIHVEPGDYLINGPIHLKSNMNLFLEEGARLVFGGDPSFYLPVVLSSWEGTRCYNYSPFIYAFEAKNVSISGKGEIDGEGSEPWNEWKQLQNQDKILLRKMNNENVPLNERVFGEGHFLRPHLIQFYECENILVEDVKITDSPFWCLHFVYSKNITVRGLSYDAYNYNNDGIDPESSENILIDNVLFGNGDDNIAIKAGRDLEARTLGRASKNIVIRNCRFSGYNAIAVGSEMSGGVHDVFVEDCSYAGRVIYGIYLKGNRDRGGEVQNIYVRNIEFDSTRSTIIIDSNYKNQGSCCPPLFKNIFIENISANYASDHGIFLKGSPQMHIDSVFISDVEIASAGTAMESSYIDQLALERVVINGEALEAKLYLADDFEGGTLARFWRSGDSGVGRYEVGAITIWDKNSRSGKYSVRMDVGEGYISHNDGEGGFTERTELDSRKHPFLGQTIEFSYSLMIPEDFPILDNRLVISQIKQEGVIGPLVAQRFRNGHHHLTIRKFGGLSKQELSFELPDLRKGEWHDFKIMVYFSKKKDGSVGFWMDGRQLVSFEGRTAHMKGENRFYHKTGLARDHIDRPMTIYLDDYSLSKK